ncbi:glycine--tRNA ligase [Planctomycetota bacterium]
MGSEKDDVMKELASLCKRRGFVFQSSEIYGGLKGCWDYGPFGVELKRNVTEAWWESTVTWRDDVVGIDSSILMNREVWVASGHVKGFTDPLVDCRDCKRRFRADDIEADKCPECGGELTEARQFNLMLKTFIGPVEDESSETNLRPETAQGIFADFGTVQTASRLKLPFGIAQTGKSFRNEITPRNFIFRTVEFSQMELEYFVHPEESEKWYHYWKDERFSWYKRLGLSDENLELREHAKDELAHYALACVDIEYKFPFGFSELEGVANRTDYDLKQHIEQSGKKTDLTYFDQDKNERLIPYVIEPSAGVDRSVLAFICEAYCVETAPTAEGKEEKRTVLKFHPRLAPVKVAVLPLVKRDGMPEIARSIYDSLKRKFNCLYDEKSSIGRRYRRQDEIGTPYCITVDSETIEDQSVTIRYRDSMEQERIKAEEIEGIVREGMEY